MTRRIAPVVRRFKLGQEPRDLEYWRSLPMAERVAAVEIIRREFHGWSDETLPRLQRVCRIVKR